METIHFDDNCIIECTKNGQKVEANIPCPKRIRS